ncbi:MAG TPA: hypothetical protein VFE47_23330 [Tepidisphaeraceae bacterium]|nr:hypothetical protein [Tepidisphaeraceae bacterium]
MIDLLAFARLCCPGRLGGIFQFLLLLEFGDGRLIALGDFGGFRLTLCGRGRY